VVVVAGHPAAVLVAPALVQVRWQHSPAVIRTIDWVTIHRKSYDRRVTICAIRSWSWCGHPRRRQSGRLGGCLGGSFSRGICVQLVGHSVGSEPILLCGGVVSGLQAPGHLAVHIPLAALVALAAAVAEVGH